jgi:hypothetical protein
VKPYEFQRTLFSSRLAPSQVAIGAYLAFKSMSCANKHGWFKVTQDEIAEACSMTRDTVIRHIPALEEAGLIDVRRPVTNGRRQTHEYRLAHPHHVGNSDMHHVGNSDMHHVGNSDQAERGNSDNVRSTQRLSLLSPLGGGGGDNLKDPQTRADPEPTTASALAIANGWPPELVAGMDQRQRLNATITPYAGQEAG